MADYIDVELKSKRIMDKVNKTDSSKVVEFPPHLRSLNIYSDNHKNNAKKLEEHIIKGKEISKMLSSESARIRSEIALLTDKP